MIPETAMLLFFFFFFDFINLWLFIYLYPTRYTPKKISAVQLSVKLYKFYNKLYCWKFFGQKICSITYCADHKMMTIFRYPFLSFQKIVRFENFLLK